MWQKIKETAVVRLQSKESQPGKGLRKEDQAHLGLTKKISRPFGFVAQSRQPLDGVNKRFHPPNGFEGSTESKPSILTARLEHLDRYSTEKANFPDER
jgi:hypothetical protein